MVKQHTWESDDGTAITFAVGKSTLSMSIDEHDGSGKATISDTRGDRPAVSFYLMPDQMRALHLWISSGVVK